MEILKPNILKPALRRIGLNKPSLFAAGKPHGGKVKPYIKGHVTDGSSTFTFTVNGNDVTVSVSGGDWKYKPTAAITSLAFVGVPQLETLELNKIVGVSTFNLDYPVVPVFKGCDATTENALNYVYHIRGTATADFTFQPTYLKNGSAEKPTERAVIDANGNWDVSYSGKKIRRLEESFYQNIVITSIEFTENFDTCITFNSATTVNGAFRGCSNLKRASFKNGTFDVITNMANCFRQCSLLEEVDFSNATFRLLEGSAYIFTDAPKLKKLDLPKATLEKVTSLQSFFDRCYDLAYVNLPIATLGSCSTLFRAFEDCTGLKSIDIGSAIIAASSTIDMFRNASALENLNIKSCSVSLELGHSSKLTEQSIVNIFNAVAADGITLTFHPTVFAMIEQQLEIEGSPIYEAYWNSDYDFNYASA